jgi:lipopolysaccharide transport system permease protein
VSSTKHYLDLIRYRAYADLKSDSYQSFLGSIWWVLDPLLYLVVFYIVFEVFLKRGGEGFVGFLLCGLVFWRWFDICVKRAASSIQGNSGVINQVYLPKLMFPIIDIVISTYRFVFVLILLLLFIVLYRGHLTVYWLSLPLIMLTQMLLIFGLGIMLSLCVPFLPDIRKLLDNGMMLLFYMSGIFFDISKLSEKNQQLLNLNPMAQLIQQYRKVFLQDQWPDWSGLGAIAFISVILLVTGLYAGKKLDMYYPRIIR